MLFMETLFSPLPIFRFLSSLFSMAASSHSSGLVTLPGQFTGTMVAVTHFWCSDFPCDFCVWILRFENGGFMGFNCCFVMLIVGFWTTLGFLCNFWDLFFGSRLLLSWLFVCNFLLMLYSRLRGFEFGMLVCQFSWWGMANVVLPPFRWLIGALEATFSFLN